jgi:hypothetical protein
MAVMTRRQTLGLPLLFAAPPPRWRAEEVRRFPAPEANQAVAVDAAHFYAIDNHAIGKYDKKSGKRLAGWQCERGRPLIHLNSGVVRDGVLYCAHSNYPGVPMVSSIEMWETGSLRHALTHGFGIYAGSATWLDFYREHWYVTFGHYGNRGGEPGRDARWTTLIRFDRDWRRLEGWAYPDEVISRQGGFTISGGVFTPDGRLLATGHHDPEMYVLAFSQGGGTLALEEIFPTTIPGQGIARDPSQPGILYGIDRAKREVVVVRVAEG